MKLVFINKIELLISLLTILIFDVLVTSQNSCGFSKTILVFRSRIRVLQQYNSRQRLETIKPFHSDQRVLASNSVMAGILLE